MTATVNENGTEEECQVIYVKMVEAEDSKLWGCLDVKTYSLVAATGFAAMACSSTQVINFIGDQIGKAAADIGVKSENGYSFSDSLHQLGEKLSDLNIENDLGKFKVNFPFMENFLWSMALLHLLLVFVSSPMVFYFVAATYNCAKWGCYAVAAALYCAFGYDMYTPNEKSEAMIDQELNIMKRILNLMQSKDKNGDPALVDRFREIKPQIEFKRNVQHGVVELIWALLFTAFGCIVSSVGNMYYEYAEHLEQKHFQQQNV